MSKKTKTPILQRKETLTPWRACMPVYNKKITTEILKARPQKKKRAKLRTLTIICQKMDTLRKQTKSLCLALGANRKVW